MPRRPGGLAPALLTHAGFAALAALLLVAVGQPLFTDDAWWHLALGRVFAREGPWLAADPLLFTAEGPPSPASWLFDVALHELVAVAGFRGLRVLHVALAAAILGLAWSLLRRASGSAALASLGAAVFAVLAAYRLVQLRPHLLTILATLALYRLLLEPGLPGRGRVALGIALFALWANVHAGFLLGLLVVAAALAGIGLAGLLRERAPGEGARLRRLGTTLLGGGIATLANPGGPGPHLAWFRAGSETPSLLRVADEWLPVDLLQAPVSTLPPSPLAWALVWGLVAAAPLCMGYAAWSWRGPARSRPGRAVDPALVALAVLSLVALLSAVRFLWLGVFPLLLLAAVGRSRRIARPAPRRVRPWAVAALSLGLVPAFLQLGAWPMLTRGLPRTRAAYEQPYAAAKYYAHAVWLLRDAGVQGNLFNHYPLGGFLGYWLAPEVRCFLNGTLNVSGETLDAARALRERRGAAPGESFLELLERREVGIFLGVGLPETGPPDRPWDFTTAHLEDAPGWVVAFRNLRSAVYLRSDDAANLARLGAWYEGEGVPFDPRAGFDVEAVIREAPAWAAAHGVVPVGFRALAAAALGRDSPRERAARDRVASLYAALGLYERAIALDRRLLRSDPGALRPRRRLVWSLLRAGRFTEAREAAKPLAEGPPADGLSRAIAAAGREVATLDAEAAASRIARLPVFTRAEAVWVLGGFVPPAPRAAPAEDSAQLDASSLSM